MLKLERYQGHYICYSLQTLVCVCCVYTVLAECGQGFVLYVCTRPCVLALQRAKLGRKGGLSIYASYEMKNS